MTSLPYYEVSDLTTISAQLPHYHIISSVTPHYHTAQLPHYHIINLMTLYHIISSITPHYHIISSITPLPYYQLRDLTSILSAQWPHSLNVVRLAVCLPYGVCPVCLCVRSISPVQLVLSCRSCNVLYPVPPCLVLPVCLACMVLSNSWPETLPTTTTKTIYL